MSLIKQKETWEMRHYHVVKYLLFLFKVLQVPPGIPNHPIEFIIFASPTK